MQVSKTLLVEHSLNKTHTNIFSFSKIHFIIIQFQVDFLQVVQINCTLFQTHTPHAPSIPHYKWMSYYCFKSQFGLILLNICVCVCVCVCLCAHFFFPWPDSSSGPRPPHPRGFEVTLKHTTLGRTPLNERSARRRNLYLTTSNTHKRQASMPPILFETAITAKRAAANPCLRPRGHCDRRASMY